MITMQMKGIRLFPCAYDILEAFIITVLCTVLIPIRYYVMFEISIRIGVLNIHYHVMWNYIFSLDHLGYFVIFCSGSNVIPIRWLKRSCSLESFSKLISIFGHNQSIQLKLIIIFFASVLMLSFGGKSFLKIYKELYIPIGLYDFCNGLSGPNKSVAFNSV